MKRGIVIDDVQPRTPTGLPAKAIAGHRLQVRADIFRDGHHVLAARVSLRPAGSKKWQTAAMAEVHNDLWTGELDATELGLHEFCIEAWTDVVGTWRRDTQRKLDAGDDIALELEEGALLLEARVRRVARVDKDNVRAAVDALRDSSRSMPSGSRPRSRTRWSSRCRELTEADATKSGTYRVWVDRERAAVGAWYEMFPRSHGGLRGATERLDAVAAMGFDVVYLPPIHPVGVSHRKGRNNSLDPVARRPGQPLGDRQRARAGTPPSSRVSEPRTTSPPSWPTPPNCTSKWRSTTRCSAHPITRGSPNIPSGSTIAPTARSSTPRTRPRSTRTSTRSTSGRPKKRIDGRCGKPVKRSSTIWIDTRRAHLPGRQPPHQALAVLGVVDHAGARG